MSREIEFRAWVEEGKWDYYVYDIQKRADMAEWFGQPTIHIEQYTGLKDKNGKEIYEGDIIKIKQGFYAVVWDYLRAAWGLKYLPKKDEVRFDRDIADMRFMQNNSGLVIGNIHENPELLEGEK